MQVSEASLSKGPKKIGATQFASTLFTSVSIQFFTVIQGIILARWLEPDGRGQLAAAILWPTFFAGVGMMGTNIVITRKAAKSGGTALLSRTAVSIAFITGTLTTVVMLFTLPLVLAKTDYVTMVASLFFLPYILFNHVVILLAAVDHGSGDIPRLNKIRLSVNPLYLLTILVLMIFGSRDVALFASALALATVIVASWRLFMHLQENGIWGEIMPIWPILKESFPYALFSLLAILLVTIDRALLLHFLGHKMLGFYVVALSAASAASGITSAAGTIIFGMLAQAEKKDGFDALTRIFRLSVCLWLFLGSGLAIVIPFLLPLIYGPEFDAAVLSAVILIPAAAIAGLASLLEEALRAQGCSFAGVLERILCLVSLLLCGLIMVPVWGLVGMAVAALLSQCVLLLLLGFASRRHFRDSNLKMLLPTISDVSEIIMKTKSVLVKFVVK